MKKKLQEKKLFVKFLMETKCEVIFEFKKKKKIRVNQIVTYIDYMFNLVCAYILVVPAGVEIGREGCPNPINTYYHKKLIF